MGLGAIWDNKFYSAPLPLATREIERITVYEMLNVLLALRVWGSKLSNKIVRLWCDNRAVVDIMTRRKTKDKHLGEILREVLMLQATYNINLEVCHIAGKNNDIADALSRVHMNKCSECCTYLVAKGCKRMNVSESDLIVDQNHL